MSTEAMRDRFGKLLANAGQMYWELDRDFKVVYANDLLIETFGDPVGMPCFEFMAGRLEPCQECPAQRVFEGAERATSERMRITSSGKAIWVQHTATPIRNGEGKVVGVAELMIDMTQRKEMEEWLRDSERLYRNLVEQVPDILFSLDAEGRFAFVNTQVEKFLGYPVHAILETQLVQYVAPEDKQRAYKILELQPEEIWDEEVGMLDAQGKKKFARIRCKAALNGEPRPSAYDGVMRDRTERRKLEEDLKASREALVEKIRIIDELYEHIVESGKCKAIEEHTAEVAHELRQPLAIIGGFARRIAKQLDTPGRLDRDRQRQYLEIIVTEIHRLEKILDRLIEFTKRNQVNLQPVNPNELIEYIIEITAARMSDKRIKLVKNLGPEIGEIPVDPGRFQQLVLNLVSNAIDASPIGGTIEVETGASIPSAKAARAGELESESFFEMKIRNSGPKISPEALQQIFNPFYSTKPHGAGIGLAVSKKIVEDHFGSISVRSDNEGTTFTVWLPVTEPDQRRYALLFRNADSIFGPESSPPSAQ